MIVLRPHDFRSGEYARYALPTEICFEFDASLVGGHGVGFLEQVRPFSRHRPSCEGVEVAAPFTEIVPSGNEAVKRSCPQARNAARTDYLRY